MNSRFFLLLFLCFLLFSSTALHFLIISCSPLCIIHGLLSPSECPCPGMGPFLTPDPPGCPYPSSCTDCIPFRAVPHPPWVPPWAPVPLGYPFSGVGCPWLAVPPLAQNTSFQECISSMSPVMSSSTCLFHFISPDKPLHILPHMSPFCVLLCLLSHDSFWFPLCAVSCTSHPSAYHPFINMSEPQHYVLF